ncbi:DUF5819 family protein [Streptomyces agglomeratus]|nr:DUF5819 family protein [Streptomyces agglomeratus]
MYSQQTNAWVRPVFEQNWRLFAPNPQSVNRHISARVRHTAPDGTTQVSDWVSLSAKDNSAVKHNVFPSHTAQNILRQAWNAYLKTHGSDDRPRTERALMIQKYLRNIAADRVTAQRGGTFDSIQLRVITLPIAAPAKRADPRRNGTCARPNSVSALVEGGHAWNGLSRRRSWHPQRPETPPSGRVGVCRSTSSNGSMRSSSS